MAASQYELERAAAEKRRRVRKADDRARRLLSTVGWSADLSQLTAGVAEMTELYKGERRLIVERATMLQQVDRAGTRRLNAEEIAEVAAKHGMVPEDVRPRIRKRVEAILRLDPDAHPEPARKSVNEEFGLSIKAENWLASYWTRAGGKRPNQLRRKETRKQAQTQAQPDARQSPPPSPISTHVASTLTRLDTTDGFVRLTFEFPIARLADAVAERLQAR